MTSLQKYEKGGRRCRDFYQNYFFLIVVLEKTFDSNSFSVNQTVVHPKVEKVSAKYFMLTFLEKTEGNVESFQSLVLEYRIVY